MKIDRIKNTKKNLIAGSLNKVVNIIMPFVVRTIFIYSLGSEYLGLNSLFTSILSVLSVTELGFSSAIVYNMYDPVARDDTDTICALMKYYKRVYQIVGCIILFIGISLVPFLDKLIKGNCPEELNIYILYILYLINTVLSYFLFSYKKSILEAFHRNDIISRNNLITVLGVNIVQIVLLVTVKNAKVYYLYVLITIVFTVLNNILNYYSVKKNFGIYECRGKVSHLTRQAIKKQVMGLLANKVSAMTRNSLDSIFVSYFIGLVMTTIYNNYYYVINTLVNLTHVITDAMLAGVGNSIAVEAKEKNYRDFIKFNFIYMWISGWSAVTLFILIQDFMELWMGTDLMLPLMSAALFSIYYYVLKMGDIKGVYSAACGLWWQNRYRSIVEFVFNALLNYVFGRMFGVAGIIGATIIPLFCFAFFEGTRILFKNYFTEYSQMIFFIKMLYYFVVTIIAAIITQLICINVSGNIIIKIVCKGLICCIVPNIVFVVMLFFTAEFKNSIGWIKSGMGKV